MRAGSPLCVNAFPLLNAAELRWPVNTYILTPSSGEPTHERRGAAKQAMWQHRKSNKACCRGMGFIVDVDEATVAVPGSWNLPAQVEVDGFWVAEGATYITSEADPEHESVIAGILKEALKLHFKDHARSFLGPLWWDYGDCCEMPRGEGEFQFCRKFRVVPRRVGNVICLQIVISTVTIDGRSFADYVRAGAVDELAGRIEAKRENRSTRRGESVQVRLWCDIGDQYNDRIEVLELEDVEGTLKELRRGHDVWSIPCTSFKGEVFHVPQARARLILDTQITQDDHSHTIIEPAERVALTERVRSLLDGFDAYGIRVRVARDPLAFSGNASIFVPPPQMLMRDEKLAKQVLPSVKTPDPRLIYNRSRQRAAVVRRHGFLLDDPPLNPALAWPESANQKGMQLMLEELNAILGRRRIRYRFAAVKYRNVAELRVQTEQRGYDAILAVLPSHRDDPNGMVHDEIKRRLDVPSQCIHLTNTLPTYLMNSNRTQMNDRDKRLLRRVSDRYALCIDNLLVKAGWVPYAPADPFSYNVHVGIDVGGRNNDRVAACIGYGFGDPSSSTGLVFRTQEVPVDGGKAEPIPTKSLFAGLRSLFEHVVAELEESGVRPDFNRVLFFRDGRLLGDGDSWNEIQALKLLHAHLQSLGLVKDTSVWTAAEVHKRGSYWRAWLSDGSTVANPVVGQAVLGFGEPDRALVFTTGEPYLSQGSADPPILQIKDVVGRAALKDVVRDFVWEADMGFTKMDQGHSLPWVLNVADTGALQMARSYKIVGVTN